MISTPNIRELLQVLRSLLTNGTSAVDLALIPEVYRSYVATWLRIYKAEKNFDPHSWDHLYIAAQHSALLPWLLDGNAPLPYPPPRRYSRPWHRLCADGVGVALAVSPVPGPSLRLNIGGSLWPATFVTDVFCIVEWPEGTPWVAVSGPHDDDARGNIWTLRRLPADARDNLKGFIAPSADPASTQIHLPSPISDSNSSDIQAAVLSAARDTDQIVRRLSRVEKALAEYLNKKA